jgi:hypothetical protein
MPDDALRLRTIVVSTRAALAKSEDARAAGIRGHADELLHSSLSALLLTARAPRC